MLAECLINPVSALRPDSVLDIRHASSQGGLVVEFGDGASGTLAWSDLVQDVADLRTETATVSDSRRSVEVLKSTGEVFSIDAGSLRAMHDGEFAARLGAKATQDALALGATLKRAREQKGLTQVQVANLSGLEQALISKLENGKHQPRFDTLDRYARALDIPITQLLDPLSSGAVSKQALESGTKRRLRVSAKGKRRLT